ncbi:MAG: serine protease, partial [Candidatus Omnitrophica bacterium CG10_big_fil_rev_8_21_14_0_10_43_8]
DIVFDASKSSDADGDMLTYMWDFGDGAKVQGESVVHTYKKGGLYSAILTVDDGSNTSCSSDTDAITIKLNKQPVAKAGDDINYCVGTDILFDGS